MQNSSGAVSDNDHQDRTNRGFKDLFAWQRAMQMVRAVYELTAQFPIAERFGLSGQMRRAAISVPSNIAEGYGRVTTGEFKQFLRWKPNISSSQELQDDAMPTLHDWTLQPSRRQLRSLREHSARTDETDLALFERHQF